MPEQMMEDYIAEVLTGNAQKNALDFIAFLRTSEMLLDRFKKGYWEDKLYWIIKYKDEIVCYILINNSDEKHGSWTIWSDDSDSNWYKEYPLDEHTKDIAWKNVDFCANCGGTCSPGKSKRVFGREFNNVCRTTMKFDNPDVETLECAKKMVEIRKNDIQRIV